MSSQATAGNRRHRREPGASRAAGAAGAPAEKNDRWVCIDVGETLIDETRVWNTWAHVLGVTPFTFMAALGAVLARGEDHREVFDDLGFGDWREHYDTFRAAYGSFRDEDLYPDALTAIAALRAAGYRLAIVANQPTPRNAELRAIGVETEVMAMSDEFGFQKPSPDFFRHALTLMGSPDPAQVAYVGDRIDNDVRPAAEAGMRPIWIRRGPWALLVPGSPPPSALIVDSLDDLAERIGGWWQ